MARKLEFEYKGRVLWVDYDVWNANKVFYSELNPIPYQKNDCGKFYGKYPRRMLLLL